MHLLHQRQPCARHLDVAPPSFADHKLSCLNLKSLGSIVDPCSQLEGFNVEKEGGTSHQMKLGTAIEEEKKDS